VSWYAWQDDRLVLKLRVQPRARQAGVDGVHGDRLRVRINAPPVDDKANTVLLDLLAQDFGRDEPEHNPFLHMGLHIALAEQVGGDRPPGIRAVHARLCAAADGPDGEHCAEHRMIECLAEELWRAQQASRMPDEQAYLAALGRL
jgi:uncharacterized protein (TIGR00251 family)